MLVNSALRSGRLGAALAGALGVAALGHEAGDHAMERQAVVEAAPHQRLDPLDMLRRKVGAQLDHDRAAVRQLERQLVRGIGGDLAAAAPCSAAAGRRTAPALAAISANATSGSANRTLLNINLPGTPIA